MSEAEQQAFLPQRNVGAKSQTSNLQAAADMAKYMEPVEAKIEQWGEIDNKIESLYDQLEVTQKEAYQKYADQLASATGRARNAVLVKYYSDFVEAQRNAVQQAMQIRMNEQMPIAEEIEHYLAGIRAEHPDMTLMLPNYPQLTQTAYFSGSVQLLEIPEF